MKLKIIFPSFVLFVIVACSDKTGISKSLFESADSGDSVKMVVFTGKISTDSLANMPAVIKLMRDNTFRAEASDMNTGEILRSRGRYRVEKTTVVLQPEQGSFLPLQYTLSENRLIIRNQKSQAEEGYFERLENDLFEKYWKLDSIKGKPVKSKDLRLPYIIFRYIDNSAAGNSGCNGFSSRFRILKGNTIRFSPVISTKMACIDITYENEFFRLLESADEFEVNDDTLILKTGAESVLQFSQTDEELISH